MNDDIRLLTVLVITMCRIFIIDFIYHIKQKDYFQILSGLIIICLYIYYEIKMLLL